MKLVLHVIQCTSIITLLFITGCASTPKPTTVKISLYAQPDVNPDIRGRASPVVLKFYELKSLAAFDAADFFSIFDSEQKTLGTELLNSEVFQLRPGERLKFDRPLQPEARYIAVVAAFRDLERSQWRASAAIPEKKKLSRILIQADAEKITIRAERRCFLWCSESPQKTAATSRALGERALQTKPGTDVWLASFHEYRSNNDALE